VRGAPFIGIAAALCDIALLLTLLLFPANQYDWMAAETDSALPVDASADERALVLGMLLAISVGLHAALFKANSLRWPLGVCAGLAALWISKFLF
jgi:hypothetical protein